MTQECDIRTKAMGLLEAHRLLAPSEPGVARCSCGAAAFEEDHRLFYLHERHIVDALRDAGLLATTGEDE